MTTLPLKVRIFLAFISSLVAIPINIGITIILSYIKIIEGFLRSWPFGLPLGVYVMEWLFGLSSIIVYTIIIRLKTRQRNEQMPNDAAIKKTLLIYPFRFLATIISAFLTLMTFRVLVFIMGILKLPDIIPVLLTMGLPGWLLLGIFNILFYSWVTKLGNIGTVLLNEICDETGLI